MRVPVLTLLLLGILAQVTRAEEPRTELQFSIDRYFSIETGADLIGSTVSATSLGEGWVFGHLDERPSVRLPVRTVWTLIFDLPVAVWFSVQLHEMYGHGGRVREFGSTAGVHVGSPWERRSSYATFDPEGLSNDDLLRVYTGGSEANSHAALLLERELAGGRKMMPMELLYVAANRFTPSAYVLSTTPDPAKDPAGFYAEWYGGGDVAHFLGYYNTSLRGEPGITPDGVTPEIQDQYDRMRQDALWNALDPGAWLSLFTAARSVIRGDAVSRIPMPKLAGRYFLPVFGCDWVPDGNTKSLELVFGAPVAERPRETTRWFSFVVRRGRGYDDRIGAVGAATESFARPGALRLGGEFEIWNRPAESIGGGFRFRVSAARGKLRGLFFDVGAKTDGHWPGRPANAGPFLRLGARFAI